MALLIGELSAQADCEVAFLSPGTSFMPVSYTHLTLPTKANV